MSNILIIALTLVVYLMTQINAGAVDLNPNKPSRIVRLIFVHHSTGENWLSDDNGGLGMALRDNNYFVSDTNYGWGPDSIGDKTDIGQWWTWFRGPNSPVYLDALYKEAGQNAYYSRLSSGPGGENEVVMFKSCFPNSALMGNIADQVPSLDSNPLKDQDSYSEYHTIANAKGIYIDILNYFSTRQDKLFVVITAPPLGDPTYAGNARAFNNWLVNDWLKDYPYKNVAVIDFYNILTTNGGNSDTNDLNQGPGNHHRWWDNIVQHKTDVASDVNAYPSSSDDNHPSQAGNLKATGEYLPLLNIYYNCWEGTGGCPGAGKVNNCTATLSNDLTLTAPIITYAGQSYWAVFQHIPNTLDISLTNAGAVSGTGHFSACTPATLSADWNLHIPALIFSGASYWADFQYDQGLNLMLTGAGAN